MPKRKYDKHWMTVTLSGKANPPKYVSGDTGAVHYVGRTERSIGYVSSGVGLPEVKVVKIVR
jgi:hypothetical protein